MAAGRFGQGGWRLGDLVSQGGYPAYVLRVRLDDGTGTAVDPPSSAQLPATLGAKTAALSLAVTQSTEDAAQLGSLTETAPATDTASSGINGRLQRIAQNITTNTTTALPAGSAIIGNVRIDQTTPGTTNGTVPAGNVASGATDSGNPVKVAGVYNSTLPTFTNGQRGDLQLGTRGGLLSFPVLVNAGGGDARSNTNVGFAADRDGPGTAVIPASFPYAFNGTSLDRARKSNSTGRLLAAANTTNATSVKASAGDLFKIKCKAAAAVFLKLYNKASAPTVGTDTPILTIPLVIGDNDISFGGGHYFSTGIAYAITNLIADADTTAVAASDVTGLNITYA